MGGPNLEETSEFTLPPENFIFFVKVRVSSPIAGHSTSRAKTKQKENSFQRAPRKAPRNAPTKAPRKNPSKVLGKKQEKAKAKSKEKKRATNNSCTMHFPSSLWLKLFWFKCQ